MPLAGMKQTIFSKIGVVAMVIKYTHDITSAKISVNNRTRLDDNILSVSLL